MPSFMTLYSSSKSIVNSRKAVSVISLSGSWFPRSCDDRQKCGNARIYSTYIASNQCFNLVLHNFCLPEQTLINCQSLHFADSRPDEVSLGIAIAANALEQVFIVSSNIDSLSLHCLGIRLRLQQHVSTRSYLL